jgi:hypothetical protein
MRTVYPLDSLCGDIQWIEIYKKDIKETCPEGNMKIFGEWHSKKCFVEIPVEMPYITQAKLKVEKEFKKGV